MIDSLVALVVFFLAFQASAFVLKWSCTAEASPTKTYPILGLVIPALCGLATVSFVMTPHWLGKLAGSAHAASDVDLFEAQSLSPWLVIFAAWIALRLAIKFAVEGKVSWELRAKTLVPSEEIGNKLTRILDGLQGQGVSTPKLVIHNSSNWTTPFLRGALTPTIYLHVDVAKALTDEELRAALAHEIGHWERGDHFVSMTYELLIAPLDILRLVKRGFETWAESAEQACDDRASQIVGSGRNVAEALVAVVRVGTLSSPASCVGLCDHRTIRSRVQRLLQGCGPDPMNSGCGLPRGVIGGLASVFLVMTTCASAFAPTYGLEAYCFMEHLVGTHCVG